MIKPFLFTVIAIAGVCTGASASVVDWDHDKDKHHDFSWNDHDHGDGRDRHHDHHDFSWDDKWSDHDDKDHHHHHDHDFRWWLVASSSGFDKHDHWWPDGHGKNCDPGGDPGGVSAVPLPSTVFMFGGALLLLGVLGWRRRIL